MPSSSIATARFTASKDDGVWRPSSVPSELPLVVLCHGSSGIPSHWTGTAGLPAMGVIATALVNAGFALVAPSLDATWGNATGDARIDDAIAWGRANLGVHPTLAPVLVGASMGGCCVLDYAADHPVTAVVALIPAVDPQAIRVANTMALRPVIDSAWSVAYPAALPAGSNPSVPTTALAQVHQQLWYATDDAISANIATYASAVGADLRSVGALGHTAAAIAAASTRDIVRFISHRTRARRPDVERLPQLASAA